MSPSGSERKNGTPLATPDVPERRPDRRPTRVIVFALLLAGALVRAAALPLPGSVDTGSWKVWSFVGSTDPAGLYGAGGTPPERRLLKWRGIAGTTEYPPLSLYELAVVGRIYWNIDPLFDDSRTLNTLVKAPGTLAEAVFVLLLLTRGRRRFGDAAVWTALAYWVNPAILLNGAVLGYLDPQMAVPAALALLAAASGRPVAAGALAACAVLTKAQALFVLPAIALFIWRKDAGRPDAVAVAARSLARAISGGVLATALILLPIVLRGAVPNMVQAVRRLASHGMLSGYCLNIWWIATWLARARAVADDWGWWAALTMNVRILQFADWMRFYPNPKPFATALVVMAIAWACWRARRGLSLPHAAFLGAWCVYAYTILGVQVHENHLYLAVPFVMIAAGFDPALRRLGWAISGIAAANMYLFYGFGEGWPPVVDRQWTVVDMSVVLAFVNLGFFAWATRVLLRMTRPHRHDPPLH